jgi:pyruvate,water dikinase
MKIGPVVPGAEFDEKTDLNENTPAWFLDGTHCTPPWTPMYAWLWCGPDHGCGYGMQYVAGKLNVPHNKGAIFRHQRGCDYVSFTVIKDEEEVRRREAKFREALRPYIEDFDGLWAGYRDELVGKYKSLMAVDLDAISEIELFGQFKATMDVYRRQWEIHWLMYYVGAICWGTFQETCMKMFGIDQASPLFQAVTSGFDNKAFQMDKRQWELAQSAKKNGLADAFAGPAPDVIQKLEQTKGGREWLKDFNEFLQEDGWQAARECEVNDPTWIEEPSVPIGNIQNFLKLEENGFRLDATRADLQKKREEAEKALLEKVPVEEQDWFKAMMHVAGLFGAFSEEHAHYCEFWANAMVRRICLAIGRRFVKAGSLDHVDDIFFLNGDEVNVAIFSPEHIHVRHIANARRKEWEEWQKEERPVILSKLSQEEAIGFMMSAKDTPIEECAIGRFPQPNPELKADIYGIPVCSGVAEGPARVVKDLRELTQVQPGEILVCPVAQPSWTPVFGLVKGVVTAQGGTLHHAAIIAREYGVPAVSNVFDAIGQITTGRRIRVDGAQGAVYFLDK